ncbi:hypothetical protein [Desulfosporosinus nitroreducens]|uniref:Uncharacterized protein n=1 Tax=Desulfosporosinus nitroreducens TaxID=2018668 RepID=A0ABT8QSH3_9FIRM|nr:hypothetical protein [Desulfosporosinus nitroreducens]MCO1602688.1 hypothetical protein [Desulfosporosinus nitroreducens]MDO0823605.1 hypothetical protein [Desulfosporosinus nitroreducens]
MSRPWLTGGSVHPCTLPRLWGRSLNGSLLFCLRKDVALVSHCVLGLGTKDEGSVALGEGTFYVHLLAWSCVERVQAGVVVIWN